MGTGSKVLSVILRLSELCCSAIVVGLLSRFFYYLYLAPDGSAEARLVYTEVISCLGIIASILLVVPFKYSFYAWPVDAIFFVCYIVAFGLLADLNDSCSSSWYWSYWNYYWGHFWTFAPRVGVTVGSVNNRGCGSWRAIIAFLFIGAMAWLLSAILGLFVFMEIREGHEKHRTRAIKEKIMRKKRPLADPETEAEAP